MFGIKRFIAVINPPQAAILAVGELEPRPVVRDGEVTVRPIMELTLTCDHRILYGADAAAVPRRASASGSSSPLSARALAGSRAIACGSAVSGAVERRATRRRGAGRCSTNRHSQRRGSGPGTQAR